MEVRNGFTLWFWVLVSEGLRVIDFFTIQSIIDVVGKIKDIKLFRNFMFQNARILCTIKLGCENFKTKHCFLKTFDFLASLRLFNFPTLLFCFKTKEN